MQRSSAKRRIGSSTPMSPIVLSNNRGADQQSRIGLLLVVFMRVVAALWLCEALAQWGSVIVTGANGRSELADLSGPAVVAVVFFAVIDPIASVGLWLVTPWGGAIWLVTVGAQLLVVLLMPGFYEHPILTGLFNLVLVGAYLVLTWQVAVAAEQRDGSAQAL